MNMMLFNIQKFSLHDGPGIRTVVFFKGCPLRCGWCSNPESWHMHPEPMADTTSGEMRSLDDVVAVCLQDAPFYDESGGGVTLSGGEALMQPDAAAALLAALREKGIHTAIETTGYAPEHVFERVAHSADLILFDIKHWDERRHIEGTGVSNAPILSNLRRAAAMGIELLPRIPVITGFNDALDDARRFAALLVAHGLNRAQLLPFHQFGEKKYEMLGRPYPYEHAAALHESGLCEYRRALGSGGIDAFF